MSDYSPVRIKPTQGLNEEERPDDLAPNQARRLQNLALNKNSIRKRGGFKHLLDGQVDEVVRGGAPASSLYVKGSAFHHHHKDLYGKKVPSGGGTDNFGRDPWNARQGIIVLPEDGRQCTKLETSSTADDWAFEFTLWTDDLSYLGPGDERVLEVAPRARS